MSSSAKLPAIFLGHGSPMNAIEPDNRFNQAFLQVAQSVEKPQAVLMVSAHWYGRRLQVMSGEHNPLIYDFYGFPQALFEATYPAPGSAALAARVSALLVQERVEGDPARGLDHGAWAVLRHFYPQADVPVVQLSLDITKPASWHWAVAQKLRPLRDEGVLIMGSGNIIHNLRLMDRWHMDRSVAYDWAMDFRARINRAILANDRDILVNFMELGEGARLAVPVPAEHFLPLLYVLAQREDGEPVDIFNDEIVAGSLSMTSVKVG